MVTQSGGIRDQQYVIQVRYQKMSSTLLRATLLVLITAVSMGCDQTSTIDQNKTHRTYLDQDNSVDPNDYRAQRLRAIQEGAKK